LASADFFELIEQVRQASIRFHRDDDRAALDELERIMTGMSPEDTLHVVRAFSFFSQLANIAEDQHHIRRSRAHQRAGSAPREGSMDHALALTDAVGERRTQNQPGTTDEYPNWRVPLSGAGGRPLGFGGGGVWAGGGGSFW